MSILIKMSVLVMKLSYLLTYNFNSLNKVRWNMSKNGTKSVKIGEK